MDDQFGNLIEPAPIGFSFGAPGWYVLGVLLFTLLFIVGWLLLRHYHRNFYRKKALNWLMEKETLCIRKQAYNELVYESNNLIKRIAMRLYGRAEVAGKRPAEWIPFINTTFRESSFDNQDMELLNKDLYASSGDISAEEARSFTDKTKHWIKNHRSGIYRKSVITP